MMDEMNERFDIPARAELKRTAREFMRRKNPSPWLVVVVAIGIQNVLQILQLQVLGFGKLLPQLQKLLSQYMATGDSQAFTEAYYRAVLNMRPGFGGVLIGILLGLATLMIGIGLVLFYIETVREGKGSFGNLLDGLVKLPRVIGYNIMVAIFSMAWMLIPYAIMIVLMIVSVVSENLTMLYLSMIVCALAMLVVVILLQIRYSQGMYFLLTRPEVGILDCITLSKRIMKPRKGEYFVLMLSFLGWSIGLWLVTQGLSLLPAYLGVLLSLPLTAFVQMYQGFTYFLYHEAIQGRVYDPTQPPKPEEGGDEPRFPGL